MENVLFPPDVISTSRNREETPLMLVWIELDDFEAQIGRLADLDIAETLDAYYVCVAAQVAVTGGRIVKHVGGSVLAVFDEDQADRCVAMLAELKRSVDALMGEAGFRARMRARAHFGVVIAGEFGPDGARHYDVVGKAVHAVTLLDKSGITLSLAAIKKLRVESRMRFKRHDPPFSSRAVLPGLGLGLFGLLVFFIGSSSISEYLPYSQVAPVVAVAEAGSAVPVEPAAEMAEMGAAPSVPASGWTSRTERGAPEPVPAEPIERHVAEGYIVQVGAFTVPANASGRLRSVRVTHPDAYLEEIQAGTERFTAVRLGPFTDYRAAERSARELEARNLPTYLVTPEGH